MQYTNPRTNFNLLEENCLTRTCEDHKQCSVMMCRRYQWVTLSSVSQNPSISNITASVALFPEYLHSFTAVEKQFPTSTFHFSFKVNSNLSPQLVGYEQWQLPLFLLVLLVRTKRNLNPTISQLSMSAMPPLSLTFSWSSIFLPPTISK